MSECDYVTSPLLSTLSQYTSQVSPWYLGRSPYLVSTSHTSILSIYTSNNQKHSSSVHLEELIHPYPHSHLHHVLLEA